MRQYRFRQDIELIKETQLPMEHMVTMEEETPQEIKNTLYQIHSIRENHIKIREKLNFIQLIIKKNPDIIRFVENIYRQEIMLINTTTTVDFSLLKHLRTHNIIPIYLLRFLKRIHDSLKNLSFILQEQKLNKHLIHKTPLDFDEIKKIIKSDKEQQKIYQIYQNIPQELIDISKIKCLIKENIGPLQRVLLMLQSSQTLALKECPEIQDKAPKLLEEQKKEQLEIEDLLKKIVVIIN